jgi:hypothetical protein
MNKKHPSMRPSHWTFRLLNCALPLLTIYVFHLINAQNGHAAGGNPRDWIDLPALASATLLACVVVALTDRFGGATLTAKTIQSLALFLFCAPLAAWLLYTTLFDISLWNTPFLRLDLPLAAPVFVAWSSSYFLRRRQRRIEAQYRENVAVRELGLHGWATPGIDRLAWGDQETLVSWFHCFLVSLLARWGLAGWKKLALPPNERPDKGSHETVKP